LKPIARLTNNLQDQSKRSLGLYVDGNIQTHSLKRFHLTHRKTQVSFVKTEHNLNLNTGFMGHNSIQLS